MTVRKYFLIKYSFVGDIVYAVDSFIKRRWTRFIYSIIAQQTTRSAQFIIMSGRCPIRKHMNIQLHTCAGFIYRVFNTRTVPIYINIT